MGDIIQTLGSRRSSAHSCIPLSWDMETVRDYIRSVEDPTKEALCALDYGRRHVDYKLEQTVTWLGQCRSTLTGDEARLREMN